MYGKWMFRRDPPRFFEKSIGDVNELLLNINSEIMPFYEEVLKSVIREIN